MPLSVTQFIHSIMGNDRDFLKAWDTIYMYLFYGLYDVDSTPFNHEDWEWIKNELDICNR